MTKSLGSLVPLAKLMNRNSLRLLFKVNRSLPNIKAGNCEWVELFCTYRLHKTSESNDSIRLFLVTGSCTVESVKRIKFPLSKEPFNLVRSLHPVRTVSLSPCDLCSFSFLRVKYIGLNKHALSCLTPYPASHTHTCVHTFPQCADTV